MCAKIMDLTGKKFGKLTVIERAEDYVSPKGVRSPKWLCQCDCGRQVAVMASNLKSGVTTACGCKRGRGDQLNAGSRAKIWHLKKRNKWAVYVRIGEYNSLEEATAARDKTNEMLKEV